MNNQEKKEKLEKQIIQYEKKITQMRKNVKKLEENILQDKINKMGYDPYEKAAVITVNKTLKMFGYDKHITTLEKSTIENDPVTATLKKHIKSRSNYVGGIWGNSYSYYTYSYDDDGFWVTHHSGDNYSGGSENKLVPGSRKAVVFIKEFKNGNYDKYVIKPKKKSVPAKKKAPRIEL